MILLNTLALLLSEFLSFKLLLSVSYSLQIERLTQYLLAFLVIQGLIDCQWPF